MKPINIADERVESPNAQQGLFEKYCKSRGITIDFTKEERYNSYSNAETSNAFVWFIRGMFYTLLINGEFEDEI